MTKVVINVIKIEMLVKNSVYVETLSPYLVLSDITFHLLPVHGVIFFQSMEIFDARMVIDCVM